MKNQISPAQVAERSISDYVDAIYCITAMKRIGTYKGEKIGIITRDLKYEPRGNVYVARAGQVVLYWSECSENRRESAEDNNEVIIATPCKIDHVKEKMRGGCARILGLELKTTLFPTQKKWIREIHS